MHTYCMVPFSEWSILTLFFTLTQPGSVKLCDEKHQTLQLTVFL